ncbi:divalent-cation tolerance protein CutA [Cephaloticoccus capnophilus]|uniref:divalent-cation tolerance protein CutA n=1 Tax=Cephaloticoccus capnophilus TaxID=1548208 RepID=UPI001E4F055C|nr:divalent-cation tolerance protein CutA [Cephaloticoccus capnophilus]
MPAANSTPTPPLRLGWTTLSERADAEKLARAAVAQGLAACVKIEGPICSVYRWQGKVEEALEYRLCFKLLPEHSAALEALVHRLHPYDIPEWVCVDAAQISEKYLSWAQQPC